MTVIAYRAGVLASDSRVTNGTDIMPGGMVKIMRLEDGTLVGACGSAVGIHALFEWAQGTRKTKPPRVCKHAYMIMVSPDGSSITQMEGRHPYTLKDTGGYYADGSGAAFALGAMHHGATAVEAVSAAIEHNAGCGGEVQVLHLEPVAKPKRTRRKGSS